MTDEEIKEQFTHGKEDSRDIRLLHPKWLEIWPKLRDDYGMDTGYLLCISCSWRSAKAQNRLYQQGRTIPGRRVTNADGYKVLSTHQAFPSLGIDVFAQLYGKADWNEELYKPLMDLAQVHDLEWGGNWKPPQVVDMTHLNLKIKG